jgi:hypothetical protein
VPYGQAYGQVAMSACGLMITKASVGIGHAKHTVHRPRAAGAQEGLVICLPRTRKVSGVSAGLGYPG